MKKCAVVTATRAEYGLLAPVLRALRAYENERFRVELIVTGTHLSESYGLTVSEIEAAGDQIDHRIAIPLASESAQDISDNQAQTLVKFTELFAQEGYRAVLLLGDRYETLAVAMAAGNTRTPVFHLCGGDTTEGAVDEWIRHAITKISYLHFPTNEESRRRIIQLGEAPERVFNCGSTSIDNILNMADLTEEEALGSIGLPVCEFALCTYHPVTLGTLTVEEQMADFLEAICAFPQLQFIVTKSNADQGGARINEILDLAAGKISNLHVFPSLGVRRYLSLMRHARFVMGNSSSGIIETPALHVPTVNIGERQRGRLRAGSVIDCAPQAVEIIAAMERALSPTFRAVCRNVQSPYGDGHAAGRIAKITAETVLHGEIDLRKSFYNLPVSGETAH